MDLNELGNFITGHTGEQHQKSLEQSVTPVHDISTLSDLGEEMERRYPTVNEGFKTVMQEQYNLFAKKHLDYGMKNVAAGTDLKTPEEVQFALTGLWFRISDKVNRWQNILESNKEPNNESLLDTFQDIANYAMISQLVCRGLWKE